MVFQITFTNRSDEYFLTSNLRCYFNYSRKGRKEGPVGQVTRRRGTVEQVGGTPLSAIILSKRSAHFK